MLFLIMLIKISLAFQNKMNLAHTHTEFIREHHMQYKWHFDYMWVTDSFYIDYWLHYIDIYVN